MNRQSLINLSMKCLLFSIPDTTLFLSIILLKLTSNKLFESLKLIVLVVDQLSDGDIYKPLLMLLSSILRSLKIFRF